MSRLLPNGPRILVTSCGRRVQLVQGIRTALARLGLAGELITTDAGPNAPASFFSDQHFTVPRADSATFSEVLIEFCAREDIDIVIPTIDTELHPLALVREDLKAIGVEVVISDVATVTIAGDKRKTHAWLQDSGFPTPQQWELSPETAGQVDLPAIVKPSRGSMSKGVECVRDREALTRLALQAEGARVVESVARGYELTVSTYVDTKGKCLAAVPRRRLEVRGGEVSKAVTERNEVVQATVAHIVESLPGARGPVNVQVFWDETASTLSVIEINARFGGGDPLAWKAGADAPLWILEEFLDRPPSVPNAWTENMAMLRFDDAVFVDADWLP